MTNQGFCRTLIFSNLFNDKHGQFWAIDQGWNVWNARNNLWNHNVTGKHRDSLIETDSKDAEFVSCILFAISYIYKIYIYIYIRLYIASISEISDVSSGGGNVWLPRLSAQNHFINNFICNSYWHVTRFIEIWRLGFELEWNEFSIEWNCAKGIVGGGAPEPQCPQRASISAVSWQTSAEPCVYGSDILEHYTFGPGELRKIEIKYSFSEMSPLLLHTHHHYNQIHV